MAVTAAAVHTCNHERVQTGRLLVVAGGVPCLPSFWGEQRGRELTYTGGHACLERVASHTQGCLLCNSCAATLRCWWLVVESKETAAVSWQQFVSWTRGAEPASYHPSHSLWHIANSYVKSHSRPQREIVCAVWCRGTARVRGVEITAKNANCQKHPDIYTDILLLYTHIQPPLLTKKTQVISDQYSSL